jgi:hypothetical protein
MTADPWANLRKPPDPPENDPLRATLSQDPGPGGHRDTSRPRYGPPPPARAGRG